MNFLNNMKIGLRLNLVLSIVMIIIISTLGIYTIINQKNKVLNDTELRMFEQVNDLAILVDNEIIQNQKIVKVGMHYTENYFNNIGELEIVPEEQLTLNVVNQITKASDIVEVDAWIINNEKLHESNLIVDAITQEIEGTATIFQRIPQGYLRISTNVINKQGKRGTGTYIPNNSPVAKTISNGNAFYGRAFVVDDWYLTGYIPITRNNEVVGIIYYGVKEKNLEGLRGIFKSKKYFDNGYPYLVASSGEALIHPTKEGTSFAEHTFFKDMVNSKKEIDKSEYIWEGQKKRQYFKYIAAIDSYASVTLYEHDLMGIIRRIRNAIILAILFGTVIFVGVNTVISRSITSALNQGVKFAETIAKGDLSQTLNINQKDEVGQLALALNTMIKNLREIVENIIQGSNSIASASQQLSSTSQQLSQGASEQASSVEEVSSTMEEIAANIEQNSENALQTEQISLSAQEGISSVSVKSNEAIDANRTIANKIKIINDIAFQTNLLALNAAVEAARAGEHGRGFAVVASEVRKLAENSKIAADEIVTLASTSLKLSEDAGTLMDNTLPNIENTTKLVQEISAASSEQNNGTNQVNSALQQLNDVTQQNAAAAEEMATSSEELSAQAIQLKESISFFQSGETSNQNQLKRTREKAEIKREIIQPRSDIYTQKNTNKNSNNFLKKTDANLSDDVKDSDFEKF